jgi:nicotinate phosphoribosyltransferase
MDDFARFINSDRYQYTESDVFLNLGWQKRQVVFDSFFRKTEDGGFAVVAGVFSLLQLIESLNKASFNEKYQFFSAIISEEKLLNFVSNLHFTGNIYAMREGELAFAGESVVVVEGDLISAKLLETPLLNALNYQMAIASKASRISRALQGKELFAFGPRRAHGFDASVLGTRAALIGGATGHSALATEYFYAANSVGTMSHSYIEAFGVGAQAELEAFMQFIKVRSVQSQSLLLLLDTYHTLNCGIKNALKAFKLCGIDDNYTGIYGIRIDSGDLAYLSKQCRKELDDAGYNKAKIMLTNSLDENSISNLIMQGACFDSVGVGDALATSRDNPAFGGVYKMVAIDGAPVLKLSNDLVKITTPARKELYRLYVEGEAQADLITMANSNDTDKINILQGNDITIRSEQNPLLSTTFRAGSYTVRPLLYPMMLNGQITNYGLEQANIEQAKKLYKQNLSSLSAEHCRLLNPHYYKVDLSADLYTLKMKLIQQINREINSEC